MKDATMAKPSPATKETKGMYQSAMDATKGMGQSAMGMGQTALDATKGMGQSAMGMGRSAMDSTTGMGQSVVGTPQQGKAQTGSGPTFLQQAGGTVKGATQTVIDAVKSPFGASEGEQKK